MIFKLVEDWLIESKKEFIDTISEATEVIGLKDWSKEVFVWDGESSVPKSVVNVEIEDGVISIRNNAFYNCTSLTSINIPDSVISIGDWAFSSCSSLTDVYYSGTIEQWENIKTFGGNEDLLNATIHFNS